MVSVDTVYQKVLAFANKEQRGYITPQEFNMFADHAQKEIFEQYCCWIFPLMFRFDELDNQKSRTGYQQRVNAFMAERMMNIFVLHNKLRVKELPYVLVGNKTRYGLTIWFKFVNKLNDWIFRGSRILKGYDI